MFEFNLGGKILFREGGGEYNVICTIHAWNIIIDIFIIKSIFLFCDYSHGRMYHQPERTSSINYSWSINPREWLQPKLSSILGSLPWQHNPVSRIFSVPSVRIGWSTPLLVAVLLVLPGPIIPTSHLNLFVPTVDRESNPKILTSLLKRSRRFVQLSYDPNRIQEWSTHIHDYYL